MRNGHLDRQCAAKAILVTHAKYRSDADSCHSAQSTQIQLTRHVQLFRKLPNRPQWFRAFKTLRHVRQQVRKRTKLMTADIVHKNCSHPTTLYRVLFLSEIIQNSETSTTEIPVKVSRLLKFQRPFDFQLDNTRKIFCSSYGTSPKSPALRTRLVRSQTTVHLDHFSSLR